MGKSPLRKLAWRLLTLSLLTSLFFLLPKERVALADSCGSAYYQCSYSCPVQPFNDWVACMNGCDFAYMTCIGGGGSGGSPQPYPVNPELNPFENAYYNCTVIGIVPEQHVPAFEACLDSEAPIEGCCYEVAMNYW